MDRRQSLQVEPVTLEGDVARREGTLRQHVIMPDGHYRDTIYYSILDREWELVKKGLARKLSR